MDPKTLEKLRRVSAHPVIGIGNSAVLTNPKKIVWGVTREGKYIKHPRMTFEGALKKAIKMIEETDT